MAMDNDEHGMLFDELERYVGRYLSEAISPNGLEYMDEWPITAKEFITNIIFVLYKDLYLELNERLRYNEHPREVLSDSDRDPDSDRRTFDRSMSAMRKRKEEDANRLGFNTEYVETISMPIKQDNEPRAYYRFSAIDEKAISSYARGQNPKGNLEIVSLLAGGRIVDSKKVSGYTLENAYKKLFEHIKASSKIRDSRQWLEGLLDLAGLEFTELPIFLYTVAKQMDIVSAKEPPYLLGVLCAVVPIGKWSCVCRFLNHRHLYVNDFFNTKISQTVASQFIGLMGLHIAVLSQARQDEEISSMLEKACTESIDEAYHYFHENYNLFDSYNEVAEGDAERWTSKFIKAYRSAVKTFTEDGAMYAEKPNSKGVRKSSKSPKPQKFNKSIKGKKPKKPKKAKPQGSAPRSE